MQTMNTDQQTYYANPAGPYQAPNGYYQSNGIEQRKFLFINNLLNIFHLDFYRLLIKKCICATYTSKNEINIFFLLYTIYGI